MLRPTKSWLTVAALAVLLAIGAACGSDNAEEAAPSVLGLPVAVDGGVYVDVSPQGLNSMPGIGDVLLVNVHVPYAGEIEGTDLFIAYDVIGDRLGGLPSETNAKIVVYCRSGGMSAIAAATLVGLGYTNVWNLDGGMAGWEEAGYLLVDDRT